MAPNDLVQLSAVEARRMIGAKQISPVELLDACIAQIEKYNPAVNAICATDFDRAREQAERDEQAVMEGDELGILHGLPCGVKDLNATAGLLTTHGSPLHKNDIPAEDEFMVWQVRSAGANLFCKTNTPEFGAGSNSRNPVWGATGNPFDPMKTAGGSSGGSAVALATNMMPIATGSDTGGSLRNPGAWNGVVGFRPTPGMVPNNKPSFGWNPLSVQGPMARSVADTALLLAAQVGGTSTDPLSRYAHPSDFLNLEQVDLASLRVAFSADQGFAPVEDAYRPVFERKIKAISGFFASMDEATPDPGGLDHAFDVIRALSYAERYKKQYETDKMKLGPNVRANYELATTYSLADVAGAHAEHTAHYRRYAEFLEEYDLFITLVTSMSPFPWETLAPMEMNGVKFEKYYTWMGVAYGVTMSGHPAISLPCGADQNGMPFGLQVVGRYGADAELLAIAQAMEAAMAGNPETDRPVPDFAKLAEPVPALKSLITDPPCPFTR
jgi:Asp-tRNA(Asn)/Glu-tRNA(Gln) amidotransferase A subunit family amidase